MAGPEGACNVLKRFLPGPGRTVGALLACTMSILMMFSAPGPSAAATNEAVDPGGGSVNLLSSGLVTVTSAPTGNAVTAAIAEIVPTGIAVGSLGNLFTYSILTTVNPGDSGVNRIAITAPAGYAGLGVTAVSVGGGPLAQSLTCPAPAAGEYCASLTGQTMTVTLGASTGSTVIGIAFSANGPPVPGSGDFLSTVEDASTPAAPQPTTPGNADGDATNGNTVTVQVSNIIGTVTAAPTIVAADGVAASVITTVLRTPAGAPLAGKTITLSSDRGALDVITQPAIPTDGTGTAMGSIRSTTVGPALVTATDATDGIVLSMRPAVIFTQGRVLELEKSANKSTAVVGDVVTYLVELRNTRNIDALQVRIEDRIPPNFKYLRGSARLNGAPVPDPAGSGTLTFPIGTVAALVDTNGNGRADRGEQGYVFLSYQLVVGSGAQPREYVNTAVATDACDQCFISNSDDARVTITLDPLFDYGTIIGKVFEDQNADGWQDRGEQGVAGVMVALDDGTYALTDEHGRYHFPAVLPGHRLIKVNLQTLTVGAVASTEEALIVSVTPGLLAKANFGIQYRQDTVTIGAPARFGLRVASTGRQQPAEIIGSAETLTVLINGRLATFPRTDIRVRTDTIDDVIQLVSGTLEKPVEFLVSSSAGGTITSWQVAIRNERNEVVRTLSGTSQLPDSVIWDGTLDSGRLIAGGEIYQYQLVATYADGTVFASPRRLVGVNRTSVIALSLTGGAFEPGSDRLGTDAKRMLSEAAEVMRRFPREMIVIEGHTDDQGPAEANLELSRKRAEAAVAYLAETEGLARDRFVIQAYGESRPLASNRLPEGRELNRRVEVKGEMIEVDRAKLIDQYRTAATATIDGTSLPLDENGRFQTSLPPGTDHVDLELTNSQGQTLQASVVLPSVEIIEPAGEKLLTYGAQSDLYSVGTPDDGGMLPDGVALRHTLVGWTQPENTVQLDGVPIPVQPDGVFSVPLAMKIGRNSFGLVVLSPNGTLQVANLFVTVADRDEQQQLLMTAEPVPGLTVKLPPAGVPLQSPRLVISGTTDPANTLAANGTPVPVQHDGSFSHALTLPQGKSTLSLRVTDPAGYVGSVDRAVEVQENRLFLLAFADGLVGQLRGRGNLTGAGMQEPREYYTEGRVALYLKGAVAGKYLVTAAFDSGKREFNQLFKDLDRIENDRLLTNLDPDKLYPVYGDSSTIVHDTDSQGVFYLAIESEELNVLVGNYPLDMSDTELASYRRTLYGGKVSYRSVSRTKYGEPDTTVLLFGAESRQAHTTDELRATGGSLYYLSHRDIIEGSEQVAILVRDRNTGLLLGRIPQQQNLDYTIRYDDGRILFNRPVASTAADAAIINQALLAGNPVFIQVDYEHRVDTLQMTASGGRIRQQIGDHLAVGGTYVKDELSGGTYELSGGDVEVRLGKNTRVLAEFAESSGDSGGLFVSENGGLSYVPAMQGGLREGSSWKTAADVDAGEWFGSPDRVRVGGYAKHIDAGFVSSGTASERGTDKTGAHLNLQMTDADKLLVRVDREEQDTVPSGIARSDQGALQYIHDGGWWGLTGEYLGRTTASGAGELQDRMGLGAMRLRFKLSDALSLHLDRQETISGTKNDLSTIGITYRVLGGLSLEASAAQGTLGESVQGGAHLALNGNHLYVTERHTRDSSGSSTATVVGAESPLGPSGKVYTEYQWERSAAVDRNLSLIGAQRQWDAAAGLTVLLTGEFADIESSLGTTSRSTVGAGLAYAKTPRFKASTREEVRSEKGAEDRMQYLTANLIEVRLVPDVTLLGKYRYSRTRNRVLGTDEARFDEQSIGLAYRPVATDRFNALTRFTRLSDLRPLVAGGAFTETRTDIASVEWSFDVTRTLEWVEKGALKTKTEETEGNAPVTTHSMLVINRLNVTLWTRIAAGIEYRTLAQREAGDERDGWVTELLWKVKPNFRLGLGYNFTEFSDNEFSDNDYSVYGWYFRMQAKY